MNKIFVLCAVFSLHFVSTGFSQATISGRVYNDISNNTAYNPGEELNNVTVWLLDLGAVAPYYRISPVNIAITNASGIYTFTSVPAGDYQVRIMQSTVPASITRAVKDNDTYPNGLTEVQGVSGTNTYANIDFGFANTAVPPSFSSLRNFQWNATNDFINVTSKTFNLPQEIYNGNTFNPTITWTTDRTNAPGGGYGADTYPQASYTSAVLGQGYPGNNKGGIHSTDNTFQLLYGGIGYTATNNDRQTTTIEFNVPVVNTKFSIYDIDHADPQRATGRIDHVKIIGYFNNIPVMPILINPSAVPWNTVSGNTAYGFADYPLGGYTLAYNSQNEDHGTVNVYFTTSIDKIIIEYEEWAPVMLIGKGILDATPPNLATNESVWVDRSGANVPTTRGISIGSIDYSLDFATLVLPIRLKDFSATSKNCSVVLNWETTYEENLAGFDIEYSKDGNTFLPIGKTLPDNNISGAQYHFKVTKDVTSGFFRLKMSDNDGKFKYSEIKLLQTGCSNKLNWSVLGNPVLSGKEATIRLFVQDGAYGQSNIFVWDITGKKLLQQTFSMQQGLKNINLKTTGIKPGTYIIGIYDDDNKSAGEMKKLIIQ